MTALSDKLNGLAGGSDGSAAPVAAAPQPVAAAPQPVAPTGGSLTDKLNAANGGSMPPAPSITDSPPGTTGNSFWYDVFHPQAADLTRDQTWRDWATKTYSPSMTDVGNAALDDVSMGTADWAQSKATGQDLDTIRQRTAASQKALGPMGPILNAATYVIPGTGEGKIAAKLGWLGAGKALGKVAEITKPVIGKVGAAATEGSLASGLSSAGHQLGTNETWGDEGENVAADMTKGAIFGTGGHYVGTGIRNIADIPAVRNVADYVNSNPGRGSTYGTIRTASNMGADVRADIAAEHAFAPDPAKAGLQAAQDAASMSTAPGPVGKAAMSAADYATRLASSHVIGPFGWFARGPAEWASGKVGDAVTAINQHAKNQAVQAGLDQAIRDSTGQRLTVNTSGFPDFWTQASAGGARQPVANPPAGPLSHW